MWSRRPTRATIRWSPRPAAARLIEDVDGNTFLDFAAGIAVVATGHCHPEVVAAIQKQAAELIHMSGTDFYYPSMVELAEKLASIAPGKDAEARLLRKFRRRSHRSGDQAGALSHQARQIHRVPRLLSRPHHGCAFAHRQQSGAAQRISARCSAASFTCPIRTPIAARMAFVPKMRPADCLSYLENELFQAPRRSRRSRRNFHRADSG